MALAGHEAMCLTLPVYGCRRGHVRLLVVAVRFPWESRQPKMEGTVPSGL